MEYVAKIEAKNNSTAAAPERTGFPLWWVHGPRREDLLSIIPPSSPIKPGSTVKEPGKTPGTKTPRGWVGQSNWPMFQMDEASARQAYRDKATVGIQARVLHAVDIDLDHPTHALAIRQIAEDNFGMTCGRGREGSFRCLLMYHIAEGEIPLHKIRLPIEWTTNKWAVEFLGVGNYYNVDGRHPAGVPYVWDKHPCKVDPSAIPRITRAQVNKFFQDVRDYCDMVGLSYGEIRAGGANGKRKKIGDAALRAPDVNDVLDVLAAVPCDNKTFPTRDAFVAALAAVKAALGGNNYDDVLDWALNYPGAEAEYISKIWESIEDAEIGWSWLDAFARSHGYTGGAQKVFDDGAAEATEVPGQQIIPENAVDEMLRDNVWVKDQEQFHSLKDGSWNSITGFDASHSNVRPRGEGARNSPSTLFLNSREGEKVITTTLAPGAPAITKAPNKHGQNVSAVNLWRPSSLVPTKNVNDEDVAPFLDLTKELFGPPGNPEREHVLNFLSYVLQNPGKKIGHAVVITGPQGCGKDTFLDPFIKGVGKHNVASISTKDLRGQFNYYIKYPVIYFQEAKIKNQHDLYNELKPYVSAQASFLPVNEKGLRQYFVQNIQCWIVASNHDDAIALEADDRRFSVHRVLLDEPPGEDYFTALYAWYDAGGTEKVVGWLLARDLRGFNPMAKPAETAAKRRMLQETQAPAVQWLRELIGENGRLSNRRVLTVRELRAATTPNNDWTAPCKITERQITDALKAEGFKAAHRVRFGNAVERLWARELDGTVTAEAMRELYRTETEQAPCEAA